MPDNKENTGLHRISSFFDNLQVSQLLKGIRSGDDGDIFLYQLYQSRYQSVMRLYAEFAFSCNIEGKITKFHLSPDVREEYKELSIEDEIKLQFLCNEEWHKKLKTVYLTRESLIEVFSLTKENLTMRFELLLDYDNTEMIIGYGRNLDADLSISHSETDLKAELINSRINEVLEQKEQLQKENDRLLAINQDLVDSITYARKIQRAIFPEVSDFRRVFSDSFVLFSPKELVSGDMYWFEDYEETKVVAIVDCTGHGVPGAFISTLSYSLLNKILSEKNVLFKQPSELLSELHFELSRILNYDKRMTELKDGMDIGLCLINHRQNILYFSGAFHNLYFVSDGKLQVIRGDKLSVGGGNFGKKDVFRFNTTMVEFNPTDCFYLTTDGYIDQFGGEQNKKFLNRRFRQMIEENFHLPMDMQKDIFLQQYQAWKGDNEQVDDVLVIGFRCIFNQ